MYCSRLGKRYHGFSVHDTACPVHVPRDSDSWELSKALLGSSSYDVSKRAAGLSLNRWKCCRYAIAYSCLRVPVESSSLFEFGIFVAEALWRWLSYLWAILGSPVILALAPETGGEIIEVAMTLSSPVPCHVLQTHHFPCQRKAGYEFWLHDMLDWMHRRSKSLDCVCLEFLAQCISFQLIWIVDHRCYWSQYADFELSRWNASCQVVCNLA